MPKRHRIFELLTKMVFNVLNFLALLQFFIDPFIVKLFSKSLLLHYCLFSCSVIKPRKVQLTMQVKWMNIVQTRGLTLGLRHQPRRTLTFLKLQNILWERYIKILIDLQTKMHACFLDQSATPLKLVLSSQPQLSDMSRNAG